MHQSDPFFTYKINGDYGLGRKALPEHNGLDEELQIRAADLIISNCVVRIASFYFEIYRGNRESLPNSFHLKIFQCQFFNRNIQSHKMSAKMLGNSHQLECQSSNQNDSLKIEDISSGSRRLGEIFV